MIHIRMTDAQAIALATEIKAGAIDYGVSLIFKETGIVVAAMNPGDASVITAEGIVDERDLTDDESYSFDSLPMWSSES